MQDALSIKCDLHPVLYFSWLYCVETFSLDGNSQLMTSIISLAFLFSIFDEIVYSGRSIHSLERVENGSHE